MKRAVSMHLDLKPYSILGKSAINKAIYTGVDPELNRYHKIVESSQSRKNLATVSIAVKTGTMGESPSSAGTALILSNLFTKLPLIAASDLTKDSTLPFEKEDLEDVNDRKFLRGYINGHKSSLQRFTPMSTWNQADIDYELLFKSQLGDTAKVALGTDHMIYSYITTHANVRAALYFLLENVYNINWAYLIQNTHTKHILDAVLLQTDLQYYKMIAEDPIEFIRDKTISTAFKGSPHGNPLYMGLNAADGLSDHFNISRVDYNSLSQFHLANFNIGNTVVVATNTDDNTIAQYLHDYYTDKL